MSSTVLSNYVNRGSKLAASDMKRGDAAWLMREFSSGFVSIDAFRVGWRGEVYFLKSTSVSVEPDDNHTVRLERSRTDKFTAWLPQGLLPGTWDEVPACLHHTYFYIASIYVDSALGGEEE